MFRSVLQQNRQRTATAVLSALSGTAILSWQTLQSPAANCEGAAEHDEAPPSQTLKPPKRVNTKAGTRFFANYFSNASDGDDNSEAASGIGGGREAVPDGARTTKYPPAKRPKSRPPCQEWDFNWDGRMTDATSAETMATKRGFYSSREIGNVRHILLVRHGQYREDFKDDKRRVLTPLGRHQAELTGQRLALMARGGLGTINPEFAGPCNIKAIHVSDMARAKETAKIISSHLPGVPVMPPDPMLNEALPAG